MPDTLTHRSQYVTYIMLRLVSLIIVSSLQRPTACTILALGSFFCGRYECDDVARSLPMACSVFRPERFELTWALRLSGLGDLRKGFQ